MAFELINQRIIEPIIEPINEGEPSEPFEHDNKPASAAAVAAIVAAEAAVEMLVPKDAAVQRYQSVASPTSRLNDER